MSTLKQLSEENSSLPRQEKTPGIFVNPLSLYMLLAKPEKVGNLLYQYVFLLSR